MSKTEIKHEEKIRWMQAWAARSGCTLTLEGECGIGRECVGVLGPNGSYPDYEWYGEGFVPADDNGPVWTPEDAYHKHPCVAVLGRGEEAETQLYEWLKWFDANGFAFETGRQLPDPNLPRDLVKLLGRDSYSRMVRKFPAPPNPGEEK